jgi:hypothetical protein
MVPQRRPAGSQWSITRPKWATPLVGSRKRADFVSGEA